MADELAKALADATKKMFGNLQPSGGKIVILSKGDAEVKSSDPRVEVRKVT